MLVQQIKNDPRGIRVGMSAAASWAWGTSLMLGMEIAQTRGLATFLIWAGANTVTLAIFGELVKRGFINRNVFDNWAVKLVAIIIQMFCLVLQLNIINNTLESFIADPTIRYVVSTAIGLSMTAMVYRKGLPVSVNLDIWQWILAIAACVCVIFCGYFFDMGRMVFPDLTQGNLSWGVWSACILLSGPIGDVQHWQRAIADQSGKAYRWGSVFFGIYMALVLFMATFERNWIMDAFILVACLMVTVSTINSIAAAMHEANGGKTVGVGITIALCFLWGLFINWGISEIWSNFGIVRVTLALVILISSAVINSMLKERRNAQEEAVCCE